MSFSKFIRSRKQQQPQSHNESANNPGSVIQQVMKKLEKARESSLQVDAERLTDIEKVKEFHLNSLLSTSQQAAKYWENDHSLERTFETSREYNKAAERVDERFTDIANLQVKLYLTEIDHSMSSSIFGRAIVGRVARLMNVTYGPLHAALKVGDVYLEWNESSLVIPTSINPRHELQQIPSQSVKFAGQVHGHGAFYKGAQGHRETLKETIPRDHKKMNFTRQIEVVHDLGNHREKIIHKLAAVIADYNSGEDYDLFQRNCQHFVQDCLTALEIEFSNQPEFPHEMQEQFTRLKRGGTISPKLGRRRFRTHSELDCYYMDEDKIWSKDELQYISLLYFKFHLRAAKAEGTPESWRCQEDKCQLDAVQEDLREVQADELRLLSENGSTATTAL